MTIILTGTPEPQRGNTTQANAYGRRETRPSLPMTRKTDRTGPPVPPRSAPARGSGSRTGRPVRTESQVVEPDEGALRPDVAEQHHDDPPDIDAVLVPVSRPRAPDAPGPGAEPPVRSRGRTAPADPSYSREGWSRGTGRGDSKTIAAARTPAVHSVGTTNAASATHRSLPQQVEQSDSKACHPEAVEGSEHHGRGSTGRTGGSARARTPRQASRRTLGARAKRRHTRTNRAAYSSDTSCMPFGMGEVVAGEGEDRAAEHAGPVGTGQFEQSRNAVQPPTAKANSTMKL